MKIRTSLLPGLAVLAIAGATPALAQTGSTAPTTEQAAPATQGTTQSADQPMKPARHHKRHVRVSSDESTPAEKAETEKLNEQQLKLVMAGQSSAPATTQPTESTAPEQSGTAPSATPQQ